MIATNKIWRIFFAITACIPLALFQACFKDDNSDCGIYLEFIYDYNMEYVDSFSSQVNRVDVFVFSANGIFLFRRTATSNELSEGNRIYLGNETPKGTLHIVTIGGLSEHFRITDTNTNELATGETRIEGFRVSLNQQTGEFSNELPPLWVGQPVTIENKADFSVHRIGLVKDTNRFNLVLTTNSNEDKETSGFTLEIKSTEVGVYGYDNTPLATGNITFKPYYLEPGEKPDEVLTGQISTTRLMDDENYSYRLVCQTNNEEVIYDSDLIELIEQTKPATNPDGTHLPLQEYLDRQSEWNFEIHCGKNPEPEGGYIAIKISINGYLVWKHDIGV